MEVQYQIKVRGKVKATGSYSEMKPIFEEEAKKPGADVSITLVKV